MASRRPGHRPVPVQKRFECKYCNFLATSYSGIVRHRNRNHAKCLETVSSASSSADSSSTETDKDHDANFYEGDDAVLHEEVETSIEIDNVPVVINTDINDYFINRQMATAQDIVGRDKTTTNKSLADQSKKDVILTFSELVTQLDITTNKIDILLGFLHRTDVNFQLLPESNKTYQKYLQSYLSTGNLEESPQYADGEDKVSCDISDVNILRRTVHIAKRHNILTALMKLLLDKDVCTPEAINFEPQEVRLSEGGERVYTSDPCSGDWWRTMWDNYLTPGCLPLVINFWTDSTVCGKSVSRQPFNLSIANMTARIQRTLMGKSCVGFIPKVPVHRCSANKAAAARFRVTQEMYRLVGKDLFSPSKKPRPIALFLHNSVVYLQLFVLNIILDGPEKRRAGGVLSACPRCQCPKEKFSLDVQDLQDDEKKRRTTADMREALTECDELSEEKRRGFKTKINDRLEKLNVRYGNYAMLDFPFASEQGVWGATTSDRMHLIQGLINNLVSALDGVVRNEHPESNDPAKAAQSYLNTVHSELDNRFSSIAPFVTPEVYLPRFSSGYYEKTLYEAWHSTAWLSLIPFLIGDDNTIIKNLRKRRAFINNAHLLMKIVYPMWTATELTSTEVDKLATDISHWRTDFREKYSHYLKSRCNHEKFHMLLHVPEDIRRNGLPGNHCSHTWEQYQRVVKAAALHTNNRNVPEFQMLKFLRTQEHIERGHEQYAAVKAMFTSAVLNEEDDVGSIFSADTFTSNQSSMSARSVTQQRKRKSMGSSSISSSNVDGMKGSVSRRSGDTYLTMYFRIAKFGLSVAHMTALDKELRLIWISMNPGHQPPSPEGIRRGIIAYKFCNICHPTVVNRIGVSVTRHTILRSPREEIFYTAVETDVEGSYAYVIAILDFCGNTFVFVRWLTHTLPGSSSSTTIENGVSSRFKKLFVTSTYAVIDVLQIVRVVCVVPEFGKSNYLWLNHLALGTALRAYTQQEDAKSTLGEDDFISD